MRDSPGHTIPYALLCVLSLALFAPSFNNGFREDDYLFLYKTIHSKGWVALVGNGMGLTFYRPGAWVLFAAEYNVFWMHSGHYVMFNWVLHLLNSFLLFVVLRRAGYGGSAAAWAAGLFVLGFGHYGKQVMWACTSGPLVAVALTMSAVLVALRSTDPRAGPTARRLAPLGGLLALLAATFHESSLVAPAIALFLCLKIHGPWKHMRKGPVFWTAAGLLWIGILALVSPEHKPYARAASDIVAMPWRIVRYVGIMALPIQNSPLLDRVWSPLGTYAHVIQLVVGFAFLAAGAFLAHTRAWGGWTLLSWLIVGLIPFALIGIVASDWIELRYVYFASMAFNTIVALWLLERRKAFRLTVIVLLIVATATVTTALEHKYAAMAHNEDNQMKRELVVPR